MDKALVQAPIELSGRDSEWNEPEPDVALFAAPEDSYENRHPRADELALLVEVSDSSFRQDSIAQRNLYPWSPVPEYWVLAVQGRGLIVYSEPAQGEYKTTVTLAEGDDASFAGHSCLVRDLLP